MSSPIAVRTGKLSKRFRLGEREVYRTLRESAARGLRRVLRRGPAERPDAREIWALRDVDLEVERGEVLGVIGANGAGKSTLLKILARITAPTSGYAEILGRVGSLLEVGTGFHPELSGRENVYLNGVILGMRKAEIDAAFDAIVAFAGVERFLDTPIKRYSSGMRVRLAFAVAAHLRPEILIVDEVLAVGDAAFQKRCIGKMSDVARGGSTLLFVSHNMKTVRRLCPRSVLLSGGRLVAAGPTEEVVAAYLASVEQSDSLEKLPETINALPRDPSFRLVDVRVRQQGRATTAVGNGEPVEIEMVYDVLEYAAGLRVYFDLCDEDHERLIRSFHDDDADSMDVMAPGRYRSVATLPACLLAPHDYLLVLRAALHNVRSLTGDGIAIRLAVTPTSPVNRAYPSEPVRAKLQPRIAWTTEGIR
ncbi:MAG TPA: polysaccharide ABC transporter ATP-binding protein [Myxococcota bacterium]|nr:polysaccharide ABC transporter ATP-binding protein [Myxococcota bacterium]